MFFVIRPLKVPRMPKALKPFFKVPGSKLRPIFPNLLFEGFVFTLKLIFAAEGELFAGTFGKIPFLADQVVCFGGAAALSESFAKGATFHDATLVRLGSFTIASRSVSISWCVYFAFMAALAWPVSFWRVCCATPALASALLNELRNE